MTDLPTSPGMRRTIGLLSLSFIGLSGVIGSGWLFAPLLASQLAGPAALLAWLVGGLAVGLLALTFAELSAMMPVAGGIARLPHFSHGNLVSMAMGWTAWVGYNTAAPIEVEAMLRYLQTDLPWLYGEGGGMGDLTPAGSLVAIGLLALFTVVNLFGVHLFARLNMTLTWVKLAVPLVASFALLAGGFETSNLHQAGGFFPTGAEGLLSAVASGGVIFAFLGFRHIIDLAGEARRPQVTVPASILLTVLISLLIYGLLQLAFIGRLTPADLANGWAGLTFTGQLGPISALASAAGILWLVSLINVGAVVSPFGGALVAVGSMGRLGLALAENGFFPRALATLNRHRVPARAMAINLLFAIGIFLFLPFQEIIALNSAAIVLSLSVGPVSLGALRKLDPDRPRPFRLAAASVTAPLAFVVATLIVYWSGWDTVWRLLLCLGLGLFILLLRAAVGRSARHHAHRLHWRESVWLWSYLAGLALISWLGDFGDGLGLIPFGWDLVALTGFGTVIFFLAVHNRRALADYRLVVDGPL